MLRRISLPVLLLVLSSAASAPAQQEDLAQTDFQMILDIYSLSDSDKAFSDVAPVYLNMFRQNDFDGEPGISRRDREMHAERWLAAIRARQIQRWLEDDLDGDLIVTEAELRARFLDKGYEQLQSGRTRVFPNREQADAIIAERINARLVIDLDGDRAISFEEVQVAARDVVANASTRLPQARMMPSDRHDADGDGIVSEEEFLAIAELVFSSFDSDGDGILSLNERVENQPRKGMTFPLFSSLTARKTPEGALTYTVGGCPFPLPDRDLPFYVLGAFEGAGLSNLYFGETPTATEVFDLRIPPGGEDLRIIAALRTDTIIRIDDPDGRLDTVYATSGEIGLIGAPDANLVRTDPACHVDMWRPGRRGTPDPGPFYRGLLGRAPGAIVRGYTLGTVDLKDVGNTRKGVLPGAREVDLLGPGGEMWVNLLRYNPGGYVTFDPADVRATVPVRAHAVAPQWAGLAELVADGALKVLPRGGDREGVRASLRGSVTIGGKTFNPGGGDDVIIVDGLRYTEERPGSWIGRRPLRLLVNRPFTMPAGLSGAHGVTFVLPEGIDPPAGDTSGVKIIKPGEDPGPGH